MRDNLARWLAWMLPRRVAYWAVVRVGVYATTGAYSAQEVPALTMQEMLQRWESAK